MTILSSPGGRTVVSRDDSPWTAAPPFLPPGGRTKFDWKKCLRLNVSFALRTNGWGARTRDYRPWLPSCALRANTGELVPGTIALGFLRAPSGQKIGDPDSGSIVFAARIRPFGR